MAGPAARRRGRLIPSPSPLTEIVRVALGEDLGAGGDLTSLATVGEDARVQAELVSRAAGVVAGIAAAEAAFVAVDPRTRFTARCRDGDEVGPGDGVATVEGAGRAVFTAERTALNFLGHLSGVASLTAAYVAAVAGTGCVIRDTRKTLPGLRALQKDAVLAGGGRNHRFGLSDGILVKDNHVAAAGGVAAATRAALALAAAQGVSVQVEVDDLDGLDEALVAGADAVLCDNFALAALTEAVSRCAASGRRVFVEASGGITLATAADVAATGVDAIAVGALTHSAPSLDIGLDVLAGLGR